MTRDECNGFCAALPHSTHVVQWGNSDVWKIGGKVFAICGDVDGRDSFTFKTSELAFRVLSDMPGLRPAPYLATRGMKWIQQHEEPGLSDDELAAHIRASYDMIAAALPKRLKSQLGLAE